MDDFRLITITFKYRGKKYNFNAFFYFFGRINVNFYSKTIETLSNLIPVYDTYNKIKSRNDHL